MHSFPFSPRHGQLCHVDLLGFTLSKYPPNRGNLRSSEAGVLSQRQRGWHKVRASLFLMMMVL